MEKVSDKHVGGPPKVNISYDFGGIAAICSKALTLVEDNSLSHGVGWGGFVGPRCLLSKVGNSIGVWRVRCSQPDGDCCILDVCWRYLVEALIRWE